MKFKISCKIITAFWYHTKKWLCGHHRFSLVENFKTFNFSSNDVESVPRSCINLRTAFSSLCQVTESDNQRCKIFLGETKNLTGCGSGPPALGGPFWAEEQHQMISYGSLQPQPFCGSASLKKTSLLIHLQPDLEETGCSSWC